MNRSVPVAPGGNTASTTSSGGRRRASPRRRSLPATHRRVPGFGTRARKLSSRSASPLPHPASSVRPRLTSFGMQRSLQRPKAKASLSSIGSPVPLGRELDRKHHLVVIADRRAVRRRRSGAARGRAPRHVSGSSSRSSRSWAARRNRRDSPIGLPAGIHAELNAGEERRLAVDLDRARHQPHLRIGRGDPRRRAVPAASATLPRDAKLMREQAPAGMQGARRCAEKRQMPSSCVLRVGFGRNSSGRKRCARDLKQREKRSLFREAQCDENAAHRVNRAMPLPKAYRTAVVW